ncbi:MAG: response regulator [Nitriliruptorales bacterium]|nr:response regulator [Nitriliruptorales bacterium]
MAKILAVDDDPVIQRLLEVNLEMEGYDVELAGDGEEALRKAREGHPDVILLDVMMPKKDGWTVCRELREDDGFRDVPIVFLSARAQDSDVERGTEIGADAYITKPFDPIDLLDLVSELIQGD